MTIRIPSLNIAIIFVMMLIALIIILPSAVDFFNDFHRIIEARTTSIS
jgi:hypothetical protein